MMMKISLNRLLVECSKLQEHRQWISRISRLIRIATVESVGSSGHRVVEDECRQERAVVADITPECTDVSDKTKQRDEDTWLNE